MLIYAQIEDAVIARIKAASDSGALGYRLADVASYGDEFDDETFFTAVRKFPAVWVTVGGSKPQRKSARVWTMAPVIAVMVGSRSVRGERFTRRGAVGEVRCAVSGVVGGAHETVAEAADGAMDLVLLTFDDLRRRHFVGESVDVGAERRAGALDVGANGFR